MTMQDEILNLLSHPKEEIDPIGLYNYEYCYSAPDICHALGYNSQSQAGIQSTTHMRGNKKTRAMGCITNMAKRQELRLVTVCRAGKVDENLYVHPAHFETHLVLSDTKEEYEKEREERAERMRLHISNVEPQTFLEELDEAINTSLEALTDGSDVKHD